MLYLAIFFFLIVGIFALTTNKPFNIYSLFRPGTGGQIVLFWIAISAIYPFFGYAYREVKSSSSPEELKSLVEEYLTTLQFKLVSQEGNTLKFIHTSPFIRVMRAFEDTITIEIKEEGLLFEGQRKDVYRIARAIEYALREQQEQ